MTMQSGRLFDGDPFDAWLRERQTRCEAELAQIPIEQVIATAVADLSESLLERFEVQPIELRRDEQYADPAREVKVWGEGAVATARVRSFSGPGSDGYSSAVHVPFFGEPDLLFMRLPVGVGLTPLARVEHNELGFPFEWLQGGNPLSRDDVDALLASIESPYLETQDRTIAEFNESLREVVTGKLVARRGSFLQACERLDGLRIPIYRRADAPRTYAAAGVKRRPAPDMAAARSAEAMEPVLVEEFYVHIIQVIEAMARGMERNPGDYSSWTEPQLRDALLVILNTHYQGRATGETFNKSGKTDILVHEADRNLFIGECKGWWGQKAFAEPDTPDKSALDQLLSYTTWRDAKLALAVFVGRQDIDAVISSAKTVVENHPAFLGWRQQQSDGTLRARVRLLGEGDRAADLAIVFAHIPRSAAASDSDDAPAD